MTRALRVAGSSGEVPVTAGVGGFDAFFGEQSDRLFGALCLLTRNRAEAEEIAQDAFLAVWERWDRVRSMDDPTGYLYRVAMNTARKRFRRTALATRLGLRRAVPRDPIDEADDRTTVGAALAGLAPRQRAAVVLTELVDLPAREAARVMGIKESTVRALAAQGRAAMRARIGDRS